MGQMKGYFFGKLSNLNYAIAIHEADANRRLASQAIKIKLLPRSEVPEQFRRQFDKLRELIESTRTTLPEGLIPTRLGRIQNKTAAKYIKLLMDIEKYMRA